MLHKTWAYEQSSEKLWEAGFGSHREMFLRIDEAYRLASARLGGMDVIPSGDAFLRACLEERGLYRDGYHASIPAGRFLLAAVWYEFFTGKSVEGNGYLPDGLDVRMAERLRRYAHDAVSGKR